MTRGPRVGRHLLPVGLAVNTPTPVVHATVAAAFKRTCGKGSVASASGPTPTDKLPPLRKGSVTAGQTAHGFIGYGLQSEGDLYIRFDDPDRGGTSAEAGWKVHT